MRRPPLLRAALAALGLAACGPYAEVAQRLDVTERIADGETWIAVAGAERTEVRVLVLGKLAAAGEHAAFSFTAMQMPISAGVSAIAWQGRWTEDLQTGTAIFTAVREYLLPDERGTGPTSRTGVTRRDVSRTLELGERRAGGVLTLAGDPALAGSYVRFQEALAGVGTTTERDAACAFQLANAGIRASEVRLIAFGSSGMLQYQTPATFTGTLSGSFRVSMQGFLQNRTTITFQGLEELGGSRVDGPQITDADSGGNGQMSGTLSFSLAPLAPDGTAVAPITGTIDYGAASDAIQISQGDPTGGHYVVILAGGGSARVSPVTAPSPSVAECLALP